MVVRKGRRRSGKKLQPPLPEAKDEPVIPKYFSMIRGSGYGKAEEERREIIPGPMPRTGETPSAIRGGRQIIQSPPFPGPAPEPERVPLLIRAAHYFAAILGVEPERPVPMPVVPELNFPALYTRFPTMKTVTKTTDAAGEISVTYSQSYATIPGVIISVKDPDNVFGTVFTTTLTGFEVRMFKMEHDHGGVVDDGGLHTPTINGDGNHVHNVQGTGSISLDTKYGWLVMANNTDYEKTHVHSNPMTHYESSHVHTNPATGANNRGHTHTVPATDGPDDVGDAFIGLGTGSSCAIGICINPATSILDGFATDSHCHPNTGKKTGAESQNHTHTMGNTGGVIYPGHAHGMSNTGVDTNPLGHRHLISNDELYQHYVYNVGLTLDLVASADEDPYHVHTAVEVPVHDHVVPLDGEVLLKNTNVTITYLAQEED